MTVISVAATNRLVALLTLFTAGPSDRTVRQIWSEIFALAPDDNSKLLSRVADVYLLVAEARAVATHAVGDLNPDLHLGPFDHLERTLAQMRFDANGNQFIGEVGSALVGLRYTADMIVRVSPRDEVDEELLAGLQAEVEALIEDVVGSSLPSPVKELLRQRLDALRNAILDLRIRGVSNIEQALDSLMGAAVRTEQDTDAEPRMQLGSRIAKVLDLGYKATAIAERMQRLGAPVVKFLTSGQADSAV
jgi:hypothetical protein